MGFTFGTKKSESKESDGIYLRSFKKGETKVRFLQEPGDWFEYREHYDQGIGKSFPCTRTQNCPGCTSDNERTRNNPRRYGTFVYLVDQKRVLPFKITQRASDRLTIRAERNDGTLLSRDYIIIKSGSGLDTDYDVDQDERYALDIDELWKQRGELEVEDIVAKQFEEAFGDPNQYADDAPKATRSSSQKESSTGPTTSTSTATADEPPPWEKPAEQSKDVEVTEAQLSGMSRSELKTVWKQAELPMDEWDDDWEKPEIVKQILKRAS